MLIYVPPDTFMFFCSLISFLRRVIYGRGVYPRRLFSTWVSDGGFGFVRRDSDEQDNMHQTADRCTFSRWLSLAGVDQACRFITVHTSNTHTHPHPPQRHVLYEQHLDRTQVAAVLSPRDGCKVQGLV